MRRKVQGREGRCGSRNGRNTGNGRVISVSEAIRTATETLAHGVQELGKRLYEQSTASGTGDGNAAGGAGSHGPNDDEVVDAEIVDEPGA